MSELSRKYSSQGLVILCFPCNQFGGQEPWPESEIKKFVYTKRQVSTDVKLFSKINAIGDSVHPFYSWILKIFPGDITWNFSAKFLVDRNGIPIARFNKGSSWHDIEQQICISLGKEPPSAPSSASLVPLGTITYVLPLLLVLAYFFFL